MGQFAVKVVTNGDWAFWSKKWFVEVVGLESLNNDHVATNALPSRTTLTALPLSFPKPLLSFISHYPHQTPTAIQCRSCIIRSPDSVATPSLRFRPPRASGTSPFPSQGFYARRRLHRAVSLLRRSHVLGLFAAGAGSAHGSGGANCSRFQRSLTHSILWYVIVCHMFNNYSWIRWCGFYFLSLIFVSVELCFFIFNFSW